jgi:hypothetical protein
VTYLLPGILLITIAMGISYTAVRLFTDMQSGIFELRSAVRLAAGAGRARQAMAVAEICRRLDGLPLAIELAGHYRGDEPPASPGLSREAARPAASRCPAASCTPPAADGRALPRPAGPRHVDRDVQAACRRGRRPRRDRDCRPDDAGRALSRMTRLCSSRPVARRTHLAYASARPNRRSAGIRPPGARIGMRYGS